MVAGLLIGGFVGTFAGMIIAAIMSVNGLSNWRDELMRREDWLSESESELRRKIMECYKEMQELARYDQSKVEDCVELMKKVFNL